MIIFESKCTASSNTETFTTPADRLRFGATVSVAIDAWFDDVKLNSQSMPQANAAPGIVHTTASVFSNLIEQLWRWLRAIFGQPEAAVVTLQSPPPGQIWTWYYYAGSQRIAMRVQGSSLPAENGVFYLFGDHLGSTTATLNAAGEVVGQMRYKPWGQTRYASGSTPTDYQYTGQKNTDLGIYFFNARWFDPTLGRFLSADTLIPQPGNPQDWDRYSYTRNNPVNGTDPTGHWVESAFDIAFIAYDIYDISTNGLNWENGLSLAADIAGLALPVVTGGGVAVRAAMHADDAINVVQAGNTVSNAIQTANQIDNLIDTSQAARNTATDLCAFGNATGPRPPRSGRDVFPDELGNIGPEFPPFPNGASTFGNPNNAPLSGHYHKLPKGTQLPDGISVIADGVDVNPLSSQPPTHHTIYPSRSMKYNDFSKKFVELPWQYVGKK